MRRVRGVKTMKRSTVISQSDVNLWPKSAPLQGVIREIRMSNIRGVRGTWVKDNKDQWINIKGNRSTNKN